MIDVKVPATSANIGPGFDCLGIALNMYNHFYVEETDGGLSISGCEEIFRNETNLFYISMKKCFEKIGCIDKIKGLNIRIETDIPVSRGLGSSASCIVGGILAANEIGKGNLPIDVMLELASEIEGHPDNVTPALLGGMTVSVSEGGRVYYQKVNLPKGIRFCSIIPDFTLSTKDARSVLPDYIPRQDGIFNIARVSLLISALSNGDLDLIKIACMDKLHQPYRESLIPGYGEIIDECRNLNCLGVFLSGAGPTIMTLIREEDNLFKYNMDAFLSKLQNKWIIRELLSDINGTVVHKTK
jgi:homoserine kinase